MLDEGEGDETEKTNRIPFCSTRMYVYGRELCFLLALALTVYATFQNNPLKERRSPRPTLFFPRTSLVMDFYYGQLGAAFDRIIESDVSFVMYYAPWDAESQATRWEVEKVARFYHQQVNFVAINCWYSEGECHQQFSHVQYYPVLIVYPQGMKGIQYHGILQAPHMICFLQHILQPLRRIEKRTDVMAMQAKHDAVVVGYFNFGNKTLARKYNTFYAAALKALEKDPFRDVGFGVLTNPVAAGHLNIVTSRTVYLYLWNETLVYPPIGTFRADLLTKWIFRHLHTVATWVMPSGVKSLKLSSYLEGGPALLLFTPRNPDVTMGSRNNTCCQSVVVQDSEKVMKVVQICNVCVHDRKQKSQPSPVLQTETDLLCQTLNHVDAEQTLLDQIRSIFSVFEESCKELLVKYSPFEHLSVCCHRNETRSADQVSLSPMEDILEFSSAFQGLDLTHSDDRVVEMIRNFEEEKCRRLYYAKLYCKPNFPQESDHHGAVKNFTGLACRNNKTLVFFAMDSLKYHEFAERLGVNVLQLDKTAVIIIDAKHELQHVMQKPLGEQTLSGFIRHYTSGSLNRHFRSSTTSHGSCAKESGSVCVQEVTSETFKDIVMEEEKDVVLFYYAPYCGFCTGASYVYLSVAKYFSGIDTLTFARINGASNDLPWEFTVESYPAIFFYPAKRKSESRVFPAPLAVNISNLLNFVLANAMPQTRLGLALRLCDSRCILVGRQQSQRKIQTLLHEFRSTTARLYHVNQRLSELHDPEYTTASSKRLQEYKLQLLHELKSKMLQLRHMKMIHLMLSTCDHLSADSRQYKAILESYRLYSGIKHKHVKERTTTAREDMHITNRGPPKDEL